MKNVKSSIQNVVTPRLILIPYTIKICEEILNKNFTTIESLGLKKAKDWPDADVIETLPRIINNLTRVSAPTGFESWMIIKKNTHEIIGDIGFKGYKEEDNSCDLGYGVIPSERRKGYAQEAATELIKWALNTESLEKITASCLIENNSSINLLMKLGFKQCRRDDKMIFWTFLK